jgi:hypothetical protein
MFLVLLDRFQVTHLFVKKKIISAEQFLTMRGNENECVQINSRDLPLGENTPRRKNQ